VLVQVRDITLALFDGVPGERVVRFAGKLRGKGRLPEASGCRDQDEAVLGGRLQALKESRPLDSSRNLGGWILVQGRRSGHGEPNQHFGDCCCYSLAVIIPPFSL